MITIEPGHTKKWLPSSVNLRVSWWFFHIFPIKKVSIDRGISKPQLHRISINFQGLGSATPNGVQTWLKSWPASPWHFANKNRGKCSHWMAKIRGWNVWSYHILPIWALPRFLAVILSDFRHASVKSLVWWFREGPAKLTVHGNPQTMISWWFQPLWKILVSWGYYSQYMEK